MYTTTTMAKKAPSSSAPVAAPVAASAPASSSKDSKPKTPKAAKTDAAAPAVPAQPVATSTDAHVDGGAIEASSLSSLFGEFGTKLQTLSSGLSSLRSDFRSLERHVARELRAAQKVSKRKRKSGNRAPSGFVKPTKISDELAKFLEKPTGTEMARTDVTREINKYIRSHNLQDVGNGRKINPDQKLQTLLKLKKTDELTYFNLQRYMSPHFQKSEKALAAAASVSA